MFDLPVNGICSHFWRLTWIKYRVWHQIIGCHFLVLWFSAFVGIDVVPGTALLYFYIFFSILSAASCTFCNQKVVGCVRREEKTVGYTDGNKCNRWCLYLGQQTDHISISLGKSITNIISSSDVLDILPVDKLGRFPRHLILREIIRKTIQISVTRIIIGTYICIHFLNIPEYGGTPMWRRWPFVLRRSSRDARYTIHQRLTDFHQKYPGESYTMHYVLRVPHWEI